MVGHGGSSAGSYLADPTSPIPSHCASIVATSTLRVKTKMCLGEFYISMCCSVIFVLFQYYVNEAAFQLCQRIPELISRRNELFPIARAVVRKSGYKFTKGRSRAQVELLTRNTTSTPKKSPEKSPAKKETNGIVNANR